ncbi:hypothetical protein BJV82DRAFT_602655 [Fennellomyces sp. T-0311]|nr:hypothetical protein BJV82DRAFT_602655 [Fennellomyces sp. T-0311]
MKIRTLTIGEYGSPPSPFCLYLFPTPLTPPLTSPPYSTDKDAHVHFLCLEDLESLFFHDNDAKALLSSIYEQHPAWFCKDQSTGRSYIMTQAAAHVAASLNIDSLVDLCRLTEDELFDGKASELFCHQAKLQQSSRSSVTLAEREFVPTRLLDGRERFQPAGPSIKQEPQSPVIRLSPPPGEAMPFDPCRDDVADRNRLSSMPRSPQDANSMTDPHLQLPKPSSLLLKRSAGQQHHKAPTNLTIFTPSYARGGGDAIRSAPLHPRGSKQNTGILQQRHQQNPQHRVSKVVKKRAQPPATAAPWQRQAPQTEFPSPPIVPSQQRCPPQYLRTATFPKTPMTNPPPPPQPATAVPAPPTTAILSKKQQFLQPFEMLYDNIEQTRQLKSSLDDHIRRSSSLIQTLQSSSSMVEALVRRHVREAMHQQLQEYANRVDWLEKRMLPNQPRSRSTSSDDDMSSPPPSQVGRVLSELVDRLDRLETKMDARHS